MSYTPLVRWRNFTLNNLKAMLEVYPDMINTLPRSRAVDEMEKRLPGYKKTAYQFGCQLGLECRTDNLKVQNYLYSFDDVNLTKYLEFWFKMYVSPNPFIQSNEDPICIFKSLADEILASDNKEISYADFCTRHFGEGKSSDILENAITKFAKPILMDDDRLYLPADKLEELHDVLEKVNSTLPMENNKSELEFFNRFSYSEFSKFYNLQTDVPSENVVDPTTDLKFITGYMSTFERNRIVFGAPGTGKSYNLKKDSNKLLKDTNGTYERVTFHPDYTYSHFVGTYKPVTDDNGERKGEIRYEFIPGPFMRVYVDALKSGRTDNPQPHLLLIEEINRAKVAAVFGDVFQLLDRDDDGVSEYEIHATEDIRNHLAKELGGSPSDFDRIRIPDNMFIWATMNSADQGVFPMDTAFKRRWDFEYLGINNNDCLIKGTITLGKGTHELEVEYNQLRKAINEKLSKDYKVNEDKLLGPFFLSKKVLRTNEDGKIADPGKFIDAFKSKLIMYLYEDAAKQHKYKLFDGCDSSKYSSVCDALDEIGIEIFGIGFQELYTEQKV